MEKAIVLAKLTEFSERRQVLVKKEMELKHELGTYNEEFSKFMSTYFGAPANGGQVHLVELLQTALNLA